MLIRLPQTRFKNRRAHHGFTLVELLIAITVIAILVGMLSFAIFPAIRTAKEATVIMEMQRLETAIELFKSKHGFYPPSFENFSGPNDLLPYLSRIAPQHQETGNFRPSTLSPERRIDHWWETTGQYLDQESSLVFWLSGICKNKRFPLTGDTLQGIYDDSPIPGGRPEGIPVIAAHAVPLPLAPNDPRKLLNDSNNREILYDFSVSQIVGLKAGDIVRDKTQTTLPTDIEGYVVEYLQPNAGQEEIQITSPAPNNVTGTTDYRYKYRDSASYRVGTSELVAYYTGPIDGSPLPAPTPPAKYPFVNPNSFQLISNGMDGLPGVPGNWYSIETGSQTIQGNVFFGSWGADNLCNFSQGRLEKYFIQNSEK